MNKFIELTALMFDNTKNEITFGKIFLREDEISEVYDFPEERRDNEMNAHSMFSNLDLFYKVNCVVNRKRGNQPPGTTYVTATYEEMKNLLQPMVTING